MYTVATVEVKIQVEDGGGKNEGGTENAQEAFKKAQEAQKKVREDVRRTKESAKKLGTHDHIMQSLINHLILANCQKVR